MTRSPRQARAGPGTQVVRRTEAREHPPGVRASRVVLIFWEEADSMITDILVYKCTGNLGKQ